MIAAVAAVALALAIGALVAAACRRLPSGAMPACFALFVVHGGSTAWHATRSAEVLMAAAGAGIVVSMAALIVGVMTAGTQLRPGWARGFQRDLAAYVGDSGADEHGTRAGSD